MMNMKLIVRRISVRKFLEKELLYWTIKQFAPLPLFNLNYYNELTIIILTEIISLNKNFVFFLYNIIIMIFGAIYSF